MNEIVSVWFDEAWEMGMTKDELQVLRALETGLDYAEEALGNADCNRKEYPEWYERATRDVRWIKAAIAVVKNWETGE